MQSQTIADGKTFCDRMETECCDRLRSVVFVKSYHCKPKICDCSVTHNTRNSIPWFNAPVCMSQYFVAKNMAGFEHNVSNEDFLEEFARDECLHNRNSKDFKDRNKNANRY